MKRLPAFTLLEVIVSMLLFGILGSIAFVAVSGLKQGFVRSSEAMTGDQHIIWLSTAINTDLSNAEWITHDHGTVIMGQTAGQVSYAIVGDSLARTTSKRSDHFYLAGATSICETHPHDADLVSTWRIEYDDLQTRRSLFFKRHTAHLN